MKLKMAGHCEYVRAVLGTALPAPSLTFTLLNIDNKTETSPAVYILWATLFYRQYLQGLALVKD